MRRGQPGIGGWRNENPRHFRPRIGGNPHFRGPRNYSLIQPLRFPPHGPRSARPHYNPHQDSNDLMRTDIADNSRFRSNRFNSHERHGQPHFKDKFYIQPFFSRDIHGEDSHARKKDKSYHQNSRKVEFYHTNSMGDVDHRQLVPNREMPLAFKPNPISPWECDNNKYAANEKPNIMPWNDTGEVHKIPVHEYTGHRPPTSDQYGCNPTDTISEKSFNSTVDEAVDIIRKRMLNRHEQHTTNTIENDQRDTELPNNEQHKNDIHDTPDQPVRKRIQRQKQINQNNCAKIKNKIVHQLFKMDKGKIHKLLDNPNSSTKFEYAISSLINESQNSYNRHVRSVAEKSLCSSSSSDFIENDNNTIYEDTFMKQMQCILDPQDTVVLEDIKPIVMAELSKVLQLEDFEHRIPEEFTSNQYTENDFSQLPYESTQYDQHSSHPQDIFPIENDTSQVDLSNDPINKIYDDMQQLHYSKSNPLYERRNRSISQNSNTPNISKAEPQFHDNNIYENDQIENSHQLQLFDTNTEQFSEEEDPFEELDKQYHIDVDHDFIEQDMSSPKQDRDIMESKTLEKALPNIKTEMNNQSSLSIRTSNDINASASESNVINNVSVSKNKPDVEQHSKYAVTNSTPVKEPDKNKKKEPHSSNMPKETHNSTNERSTTTAGPLSAQKRSVEQRPSHRKEKRKKSELAVAQDSNKKILNKNIIINVNDCAKSSTENFESPQSIFNLFFSKENNKSSSKDNKRISGNKKKESPKVPDKKGNKSRKKLNSTSSNHSVSPKDITSPNNNKSPVKLDTKNTLKPIDMFVEQTKKVNHHQAHRNTAPIPNSTDVNKSRTVPQNQAKKVGKKHVETQTAETKASTSRFCQTVKKTYAVKAVQTDPEVLNKSGAKSSDTFERMKEIDMEIQVLLQEKFKLYSTLESKDSSSNSLQNLGMTVLNVNSFDEQHNESSENILTEETIVDDFVNIPVEELEQIALESVQASSNSKPEKRQRNKKVSISENLNTSTITANKRNKKSNTPNISLIEQIITDDRPLEDIISLDDLEVTPIKTKKSSKKPKRTAKKKLTKDIHKFLEKSLSPKQNIPIKIYQIRECSVVLTREDVTKYLKSKMAVTQPQSYIDLSEPKSNVDTPQPNADKFMFEVPLLETQEQVVEETVVSDIQFDMLDVSEDIVIGDSCEAKSIEYKETVEQVPMPVCEEIILGNSQSSAEEMVTPAGKEDECKVYDYSADENLRRDSVTVNGNGDAVLAIECVENNFLAACLDGNVYYFSGDGRLITTLRGSNLAVTCLTIVKEKFGTTVYTGSLDSRIRYYDLENGLERGPEVNVLSPIQTMDRAWDTVFVGTRTGFVLQFECKNNMLIPVSTVKFSEQSILALRAMKEGPRKVLLVAARSENVTIKDAQTGLLLRTLVGPKMTVYTLLYEDGKVFCGTSSHQIHVFDYASGSHVGTHAGGKGTVCLRAAGGLVFAGCYDGCVYVFREGEATPRAQLRGPGLMLLSLAVCGTKIIAGYKDRSLYIWKIPLCILQEMIL